MVRDRGYQVLDEELEILSMSLSNFVAYVEGIASTVQKSKTRSLLSRSYMCSYDDRKMVVYYGSKTNPKQKQISADVVREFIGIIQKYDMTDAMLIVDVPLSSTAEKELSAVTLSRWQVFFDSELTYNPTEHVYVPRHELLSPEATEKKLKELRVNLSGLLIIKLSDPIVRYYGWTVGSIIKIHRDDGIIDLISPKSINYRVVVG